MSSDRPVQRSGAYALAICCAVDPVSVEMFMVPVCRDNLVRPFVPTDGDVPLASCRNGNEPPPMINVTSRHRRACPGTPLNVAAVAIDDGQDYGTPRVNCRNFDEFDDCHRILRCWKRRRRLSLTPPTPGAYRLCGIGIRQQTKRRRKLLPMSRAARPVATCKPAGNEISTGQGQCQCRYLPLRLGYAAQNRLSSAR